MTVELTFLGLVGPDVRADVAFELLRSYTYDCCDWSGARRQPEASPTGGLKGKVQSELPILRQLAVSEY